MRRRDLLKTSAAAAGLMGSLKISPMLAEPDSDPQKTSEQTGAPLTDNRPAEYLHRVRGDSFLPKAPAPWARTNPLARGEDIRPDDCPSAALPFVLMFFGDRCRARRASAIFLENPSGRQRRRLS